MFKLGWIGGYRVEQQFHVKQENGLLEGEVR
jgi:hypothetical protein